MYISALYINRKIYSPKIKFASLGAMSSPLRMLRLHRAVCGVHTGPGMGFHQPACKSTQITGHW